ncbi:MAG: hypothetical protein ACI9LM_003288 [Alteromonadaceae bacterium]|jgi:hypothetical protein
MLRGQFHHSTKQATIISNVIKRPLVSNTGSESSETAFHPAFLMS